MSYNHPTMRMPRGLILSFVPVFVLVSCLLSAEKVEAIVVLGGEGRQSPPATGPYAQSGVQFTGRWGAFTGTAIGPHHFLTAAHVRGSIGQPFFMAGRPFFATALYVVPGTDLAVWKVLGTLPAWAKLYTSPDEVGKEAVLYGRGQRRGDPVIVDGKVRGWLWGDSDQTLSWGRNRVRSISAIDKLDGVLTFPFDGAGGPDEAAVSHGDSGGGVFLQDEGVWKLAGVIYAVNGRYSRSVDGKAPFMATLFDARGLYQAVGDQWGTISRDTPTPLPTISFATRVSSSALTIQAILAGKRESLAQYPTRRVLLIACCIGIVSGFAVIIALDRRRKGRKRKRGSIGSSLEPS